MGILSGLIKEKKYKKTAEGYKLTSQYTDSTTVNMPDGNTAETNLGAIKGITSSLNTTEEGYAADATVVNQLNNNIDTLNSNLGNCTFDVQSDGAYVTYTPAGGADPVSKKLGNSKRAYATTGSSNSGSWNNEPTFTFYITIHEDDRKDFSTSNYNYYFGINVYRGNTSGSEDKYLDYASSLVTNSYNSSTGLLTVQYRWVKRRDTLWHDVSYGILALIPKSYE